MKRNLRQDPGMRKKPKLWVAVGWGLDQSGLHSPWIQTPFLLDRWANRGLLGPTEVKVICPRTNGKLQTELGPPLMSYLWVTTNCDP